jgi:hypothetical protein
MENGKQSAFACVDSQKQYLQEGLTKREYFAGLAMQGILASNTEGLAIGRIDIKGYAEMSIMAADALLAELEKTKELEDESK